jgi:hypothetical protein
LAPDGSAHLVGSCSIYNENTALEELVTYSDVPAKNVMYWDSRGHELPATVLPAQDGTYRCTAKLIEPVMPGEQFQMKTRRDIDNLARRDGGEWVVSDRYSAGGRGGRRVYDFSYLLPPHAVITEGHFYSVVETPQGVVCRIRFEFPTDKPYEYRFKYRLNES